MSRQKLRYILLAHIYCQTEALKRSGKENLIASIARHMLTYLLLIRSYTQALLGTALKTYCKPKP